MAGRKRKQKAAGGKAAVTRGGRGAPQGHMLCDEL